MLSHSSNYTYYKSRTPQIHDYEHIVTGGSFDSIGEIIPYFARQANIAKHLSPELAAELNVHGVLGGLRLVSRAGLHYPEIWPLVLDCVAKGIRVGQQSEPYFMAKFDNVLHLRACRGACGAWDSRRGRCGLTAAHAFSANRQTKERKPPSSQSLDGADIGPCIPRPALERGRELFGYRHGKFQQLLRHTFCDEIQPCRRGRTAVERLVHEKIQSMKTRHFKAFDTATVGISEEMLISVSDRRGRQSGSDIRQVLSSVAQ